VSELSEGGFFLIQIEVVGFLEMVVMFECIVQNVELLWGILSGKFKCTVTKRLPFSLL